MFVLSVIFFGLIFSVSVTCFCVFRLSMSGLLLTSVKKTPVSRNVFLNFTNLNTKGKKMPRFRPFISESSSAAPALVDVVKNLNGVRYIAREELDDNLPALAFYDLKEMVKSTDVRLEPVSPVLFPARSVNFDLTEISSSSEDDNLNSNSENDDFNSNSENKRVKTNA